MFLRIDNQTNQIYTQMKNNNPTTIFNQIHDIFNRSRNSLAETIEYTTKELIETTQKIIHSTQNVLERHRLSYRDAQEIQR